MLTVVLKERRRRSDERFFSTQFLRPFCLSLVSRTALVAKVHHAPRHHALVAKPAVVIGGHQERLVASVSSSWEIRRSKSDVEDFRSLCQRLAFLKTRQDRSSEETVLVLSHTNRIAKLLEPSNRKRKSVRPAPVEQRPVEQYPALLNIYASFTRAPSRIRRSVPLSAASVRDKSGSYLPPLQCHSVGLYRRYERPRGAGCAYV